MGNSAEVRRERGRQRFDGVRLAVAGKNPEFACGSGQQMNVGGRGTVNNPLGGVIELSPDEFLGLPPPKRFQDYTLLSEVRQVVLLKSSRAAVC